MSMKAGTVSGLSGVIFMAPGSALGPCQTLKYMLNDQRFSNI